MDVVYILGNGSIWSDNELRYSLRSIEMHLRGYGNVYIIGHCPTWIREVIHLPLGDVEGRKEYSIVSKILLASHSGLISDPFFYMNDDYYFISDINVDQVGLYQCGSAEKIYFAKTGRNKTKIENLLELYPEALYYDNHQPFIFHKREFIVSMSKLDWVNKDYPVKSAYMAVSGNQDYCPYEFDDFKIKYPLTLKEIDKIIFKRLIQKRFSFSIGPKSLNDDMKRILQTLFPKKSKYEE